MQDRYVGDVGDFVKYGLLRRLSPGKKLGVAWYLHPDQDHNDDGKHDSYLDQADAMAALDPTLFTALHRIRAQRGGVEDVEAENVLGKAVFSGQRLGFRGPVPQRRVWRGRWFDGVLQDLRDCDLVFADPDNGLCLDERFKPGQYLHWKRMPLHEAMALASGRCAVLYHHNTHRKGGHPAEVDYWLGVLPAGSLALRARAGTARTFFIVNPTADIRTRLVDFAREWALARVELHPGRTD